VTWVRGEPVLYLEGVAVRFLARWKEDFVLPGSLCRPLYDTINGGPPRAWECLVCPHELTDKVASPGDGYEGRRVFATERGMQTHLVRYHQWEGQGNLFDGYQGDLAHSTPRGENGSSTEEKTKCSS
jgi:hypothetical protein